MKDLTILLIHALTQVPTNTLFHPKYKSGPMEDCSVLHEMQCGDFTSYYIHEMGQFFVTRVDEHLKTNKSVAGMDRRTLSHHFTWHNIQILNREQNKLKKKIQDRIVIHQQA